MTEHNWNPGVRLVDKVTHEPCPTDGLLLCTIKDPGHRHLAEHMLGKPPEIPGPGQEEYIEKARRPKTPPAVLLARLENHLKDAELAMNFPNYTKAKRAIEAAQETAAQIREVI